MAKANLSHVLRDEEQIKEVLHRLKRANGQLGAIIKMIQEGRDCQEIVHQIAAVNKAVNTAAFTLISSSLKECIIDGSGNSDEISEKLQKLFLSLA
jgi:DNA-binding FrmR family transcriptional regulator